MIRELIISMVYLLDYIFTRQIDIKELKEGDSILVQYDFGWSPAQLDSPIGYWIKVVKIESKGKSYKLTLSNEQVMNIKDSTKIIKK